MLTKEEKKIAYEFATALDDIKSIAFYEYCIRHYPLNYLREKLITVLNIPDEKIMVSKGAYFNKLVKKSGDASNYYDSNYHPVRD